MLNLHKRGRNICDEIWKHDIPADYVVTPNNQLLLVVNDRQLLGHVADQLDPDSDSVVHLWSSVRVSPVSVLNRSIGLPLCFRPRLKINSQKDD